MTADHPICQRHIFYSYGSLGTLIFASDLVDRHQPLKMPISLYRIKAVAAAVLAFARTATHPASYIRREFSAPGSGPGSEANLLFFLDIAAERPIMGLGREGRPIARHERILPN